MKKIWCVLALLIATTVIYSQADDIFGRANEAYRKKAYDEAILGYEELLAAGYEDAKVHYNLGNAYYRQNKLGPAILHYEKADLMAPGDEDIAHNLKLAREKLPDKLETLPEFFLTRWWRNLAVSLGTTTWSVLALLTLWAGIAGFIIWLLARQRRFKKLGFLLGIVLILFSILPFSLAASRAALDRDSGYAIILAPETNLVSGPESTNTVLTVHEGLKVKILDTISDWKKVSLRNGEEGWLPTEVLGEI